MVINYQNKRRMIGLLSSTHTTLKETETEAKRDTAGRTHGSESWLRVRHETVSMFTYCEPVASENCVLVLQRLTRHQLVADFLGFREFCSSSGVWCDCVFSASIHASQSNKRSTATDLE